MQRHLTRPPPQYQDQPNPSAQQNPFQQQPQVSQFQGICTSLKILLYMPCPKDMTSGCLKNMESYLLSRSFLCWFGQWVKGQSFHTNMALFPESIYLIWFAKCAYRLIYLNSKQTVWLVSRYSWCWKCKFVIKTDLKTVLVSLSGLAGNPTLTPRGWNWALLLQHFCLSDQQWRTRYSYSIFSLGTFYILMKLYTII